MEGCEAIADTIRGKTKDALFVFFVPLPLGVVLCVRLIELFQYVRIAAARSFALFFCQCSFIRFLTTAISQPRNGPRRRS